MLHRIKRLPSPAATIAFIALVAAIGTGSAIALEGKNTVDAGDLKKNSVGASEAKKNAIRSGEVKNDSLTGDDINEGTLDLPDGGGAPAAGITFESYNATLQANQSKTVTIGNFTVTSATNAAGQCGPIQLQAGNLNSQRSIGLNAAFANLNDNATANIANANVSQAFTAVSDDGTSTMSGIVGRAQQGNTCLLSGYITGN
jgi:hypothetical protein